MTTANATDAITTVPKMTAGRTYAASMASSDQFGPMMLAESRRALLSSQKWERDLNRVSATLINSCGNRWLAGRNLTNSFEPENGCK